ncbi:MAG: cytochrome C biogenesis protein [Candidatus Andersenbacteria bacterium]|nr:cytochrome C biogenesis protein [Candidatus Andersenbacteria bacterium]MBI3251220.1 cytochrome C biogenesis protein [Candidatus Andersenbacteria bacterium]
MTAIPITVAFVAGVVSFLSPCVLPIIPGYLVYLAGTSTGSGSSRRETFLNSIFFVIGFGLVFALIGVLLNTLLSRVAYDAQIWLSRIGGVIIMFFGLYLLELIKIPWLSGDHRIQVRSPFASRYATSAVFGAAFAAGWTPCVGAVLGAILGLATTQPGLAFTLLMTYSIGFGLPFTAVGLFTEPASRLINRYAKVAVVINKLFGVLLIVLGVLVFTQTLSRLGNFELLTKILTQ